MSFFWHNLIGWAQNQKIGKTINLKVFGRKKNYGSNIPVVVYVVLFPEKIIDFSSGQDINGFFLLGLSTSNTIMNQFAISNNIIHTPHLTYIFSMILNQFRMDSIALRIYLL